MTMKHAPQCDGQYVLVATHGSLLLVDLINLQQIVVHRGYKHYFGITKSDRYIYVGAIMFSKVFKKSEILVFDYSLNLIKTIKPDFPFCGVHELLYHDNKLYALNTTYNMIAIYDGAHWEQWYPLGEPDKKLTGIKKDINHFNSISIYGDKIYVVAHNHGPSTVHIYSLNNRQKLDEINIGICAHNIWLEDDILHVCSSEEGTIVNTLGFIKHIAEWPRGISLCRDSIIVGSSALGGHGAEYGTHNAHIYIYDKNWNTKGLVVLIGEGQVYDLFSIELCFNPAKFFNDENFEKQTVLGLHGSPFLTKEMDFLLKVYSTTSVRAGCQTRNHIKLHNRICRLEGLLQIDKLIKLKRLIKKIFNT